MNLLEDNISTEFNLFDDQTPFEIFENQKVFEEVTPSRRETVVNLNNLDNPRREKYIKRMREKLANRKIRIE